MKASQEIENIRSLLSDSCTSTNQSSEAPVNIGTAANADALAILEEAEVAAEKRSRDQFPDVNAGVAMRKKSSLKRRK